MAISALPDWLQMVLSVLQGAAVPVIGGIGAWVAIQQMRIARVKLQHDLFDRRYAVFQAARSLISEVAFNESSTNDTFARFAVATADAVFLFDDGIVDYLHDVRAKAAKLHSIRIASANRPAGLPSDEARKANDAMEAPQNWLIDQAGVLEKVFRPFLQLDRAKRSAPRRS